MGNYLVKSMSPFFSSLPHFEIAKVVTFFKDMIWVKLVSLQSVFYIFCVFCHSTKVFNMSTRVTTPSLAAVLSSSSVANSPLEVGLWVSLHKCIDRSDPAM